MNARKGPGRESQAQLLSPGGWAQLPSTNRPAALTWSRDRPFRLRLVLHGVVRQLERVERQAAYRGLLRRRHPLRLRQGERLADRAGHLRDQRAIFSDAAGVTADAFEHLLRLLQARFAELCQLVAHSPSFTARS